MYKQKSDIITHEDIAQPGAVTDYLLKEFQDLVAYTPTVSAAIKKMAGEIEGNLSKFNLDGAKVADLKKVNAEIEKANKLNIDAAKAKKIAADAQAALSKAEREQIKTDKEKIILNDKKQKQEEKGKKLTDEQIAQSQLKRKQQAQTIALLKAEQIELSKTAGTLEKLNAANTRLRIERERLNIDTAEGKKRLAEINAELDKNNKLIFDNSDKLKQQKLNVGNYKESIKEAAAELGLYDGVLGKALNVVTGWIETLRASKLAMEEQAIATKGADAATSRWGKTLTGIKFTIKALGIGALIGLLGSIAASFKTTESGIIKFDAALASLGDIIKIFIGRLGQFGKGLLEFFPALFKDISNGITNAKNDLLEFFGAAEKAPLSTDNASKALTRMKNAFDGIGEAIKKTIDLETQLATLRRQNRKDNLKDLEIIRVYASEVEVLNQIANDQTLSFKEREDAANKSLEVLKKSADAEVRIKQRAVAESQKELEVRKLQNEDILEAQEKLSEALDQLDDAETKRVVLTLQGQQNVRMIRIKQMQNEIALIEQTFDKEKELMDKQIADQERSFKEREELARKQEAQSKKKYEDELAVIAEQAKAVIDSNDLITESNDKALQAKIRALRLGDKAEDALLKALTNRKAEIKSSNEQLSDIEKQRTEDKKKQSLVQNDIDNERLRRVQINLNAELVAAEENYQLQRIIYAKLYQLKIDQLKADAEFEKKKVEEDKTKSPELKAKEKIRIEEKLQNDLLELKNGYIEKDGELEKKLAKQRIDAAKKTTDAILNGVASGLEKKAELQQAEFDKEIEFQKRNLDIQAKLAAEGKANTLAEAQAAIDQAEERKIQAQKRAQETEKNIAILKSFTETLKQALGNNKPFVQALGEATAASGLTEQIISKLVSGSYKDGTEDTGKISGTGIDGQGGRLAILHDEEAVLNQSLNKQKLAAGMTNEEMVANAIAYKKNDFPVFEKGSLSTTQQNVNSELVTAMRQDIRTLTKVIQDKPVPYTSLDGLGEWTDTIMQRGIMIQKKHRQTKTRPSLRAHR